MASFNEEVINKSLSKHFNAVERQEIDRTRYHARKLMEHAAKEAGLDGKGIFKKNSPTFKVMSRKAFISSVLEESESAQELCEELNNLDESVEEDEDSKMIELGDEDETISKLNTLLENISLYLDHWILKKHFLKYHVKSIIYLNYLILNFISKILLINY